MLRKIKTNSIIESPWQGRMVLFENEKDEYTQTQIQALAEDIRTNGLISPVIVRPKGTKYELIDGHRRVIACKMLNLDAIDAIVQELDDKHAQISSVTANLQRKNLSAIELAIAYQKILDSGIFNDKKELSKAIGKDETYIGDLINTLNMDQRIVDDLKKTRKINDVRMLRAIRRYDKCDKSGLSDRQWNLYQKVLKENLSRQALLDMTRKPAIDSDNPENNFDISFQGKKAIINVPAKLSKDQKRVFANLLKQQLPDIIKTIMD